MPELVLPTTAVQRSFLAAMAEFQAEGRGGPADDTMIGAELRSYASRWADPAVFGEYVASLRAEALEETPRPAGGGEKARASQRHLAAGSTTAHSV